MSWGSPQLVLLPGAQPRLRSGEPWVCARAPHSLPWLKKSRSDRGPSSQLLFPHPAFLPFLGSVSQPVGITGGRPRGPH